MKKKGFTLIELIAVIVILSVIMLVSVPSLVTTIKENREKRYQDYVDNLYIAAENYVTSKSELLNSLDTPGAEVTFTIQDLIVEGYVKSSNMNRDFSDITENTKIKVIVNSDQTFKYELEN